MMLHEESEANSRAGQLALSFATQEKHWDWWRLKLQGLALVKRRQNRFSSRGAPGRPRRGTTSKRGGDGGSERAKAARDGLDSAPNSEGNAASGRASGLSGSTHHESRAGLRGADSKSEADMMERRSDRDRPDSAGGDSSALRATGWERQRSGA